MNRKKKKIVVILITASVIIISLMLFINSDEQVQNKAFAYFDYELEQHSEEYQLRIKEYVDNHPDQFNMHNAVWTYVDEDTFYSFKDPVCWWYCFDTEPEFYEYKFYGKAVYFDDTLVLIVGASGNGNGYITSDPIVLYSSRIAATGVQPGDVVPVYYGFDAAYMECRKKAGLRYEMKEDKDVQILSKDQMVDMQLPSNWSYEDIKWIRDRQGEDGPTILY